MTVEYEGLYEKFTAAKTEDFLCLISNLDHPNLVYSANLCNLDSTEITLSNNIHYDYITEFLVGHRYFLEIPYFNIEAIFTRVEKDKIIFKISNFYKNQIEILAKERPIGYFEFINPHDKLSKITKNVVAKKHHQIVVQNKLNSNIFTQGLEIKEGHFIEQDKAPTLFNATINKAFYYYNKSHERLNCVVLNLFT